MRCGRSAGRAVLVGLTACVLAVLIITAGGSAQARDVRHAPATWKPARAWRRPSAIGRVVRGPNGDGEVEIRHGDRWSAPAPLSVNGEQVNITGVSCASTSFCGAISNLDHHGRPDPDAENYAFALSGGTWIASARILGFFAAISCPVAGTCVTLGTDERGEDQLVFSAGAWGRAQGIDLQALLYSQLPVHLSCANATSCLAVAATGRTWEFTGPKWTVVRTGLPTSDDAESDSGLYRGQDLDAVDAVACPAAGLCVAVGIRSDAKTGFGPYGFYAFFRDGAWSREVRLATGPKATLSVLCRARLRCQIPLTGRTALTSRTWARLPRHAPGLPLPTGLPTLGAVRLTGSAATPTVTATISAGAGRITSVGLYPDDGQLSFVPQNPASTDLTATVNGRSIPVTLQAGGGELGLSFPDPATTITLTVAPPEITASMGTSPPAAGTDETLFFEITNSRGTEWLRARTVKLPDSP